jgi:flavodoxin
MSTLIVSFSRTGHTQTVADLLAERLHADVERIMELGRPRTGLRGWALASLDTLLSSVPALEPSAHDPSRYDLVVIGTPVWLGSIAAPVRTFLMTQRSRLPAVAFFCTYDRRGSERALAQMADACGRKPLATLALRTEQITYGTQLGQLRQFIETLGPRARIDGAHRPARRGGNGLRG